MTRLDEAAIRRLLDDRVAARLSGFETFAEIESTNSYLMNAAAPPAGRFSIALTDNQTMGRGRHGRVWVSPPGSGLCLSIAHTYRAHPPDLPALTLATGLGVIEALARLGCAGIRLKWPNDLIAGDGKLGGILTETQTPSPGAITVVTGVGINVELGAPMDGGALRPVDLSICDGPVPPRDELAAGLINTLCAVISDYGTTGFAAYAQRWAAHDWLLGKRVTVVAPRAKTTGTAAGVDVDGALLVDTGAADPARITSGTVLVEAAREATA